MAERPLWKAFTSRTVFGFHGNTASRIADAERNGFYRDGKAGDWLGYGWYFWQDAPVRAWQWADDVVTREAKRDPGVPGVEATVLMARLEFNEDWIDLIESSAWADRLRSVAQHLDALGLLPQQTADVPASRLHRRDCELIERAMDAVRLSGRRVDAIRCAFIEGQPLCENSAIFDKSHVQIVIRNSSVIQEHVRIARVE